MRYARALTASAAIFAVSAVGAEAQLSAFDAPPSSFPPIKCGNIELTLKTTAPKAAHFTAYDRLLKGHAYEFVDGEPVDRSSAQLEAIAKAMKSYVDSHERATIVIHFHGGLVERCDGYSGAAALAGAYAIADAFPVFPIYNVGAGESVDKGWSGESARNPRYAGDGRALDVTTRFWYGRGLLAEPVTDTRSIAFIPRLEKLAAERATRFAGRRTHEDDFSNGALTKLEEQLRLGIWWGLNDGYMSGGRAWSYMKWVMDRSLAIDSNDNWASRRDQTAMLPLMDKIRELTANKHVMIVLVAHSAGAIYASKFLRAWKRSAREYWHDPHAANQDFSMILLAPAVRYDDFQRSLDDAGDMLHGRLRIFTMYDGAERDSYDGPMPGIRTRYYRLSLLYAISGLFEPWPDAPLLGMQRFACAPFSGTFADRDKAYTTDLAKARSSKTLAFAFTEPDGSTDLDHVRKVDDWFVDNHVAHAFAFSPSAPGTPLGMRTRSIAHGEFPRDYQTISSIVALVQSSSKNPPPDDPWAATGATNDNCATTFR